MTNPPSDAPPPSERPPEHGDEAEPTQPLPEAESAPGPQARPRDPDQRGWTGPGSEQKGSEQQGSEQQGWGQQGSEQQGWGQPGWGQPGWGQQTWSSQAPPPYPAGAYSPGQAAWVPDHPKATTALVLGICSLVLCQVIGPFAWMVGKRTLDEIDAAQGRIGGRGTAEAGYVLGIVATVILGLAVVAVVGYLLLMVLLFGVGMAGM